MSGYDVEAAMVRSLAGYRCFGCGGVLVGYHWCPCCWQLVHPGCECASWRGRRMVRDRVVVGEIPDVGKQEERRA